LAGENISAGFVVPTVASCVDLVVHLAIDPAGHRRVREIVSVPGRVEQGVIETEALFTTPGTRLERAKGMPNRLDRFAQAGIDIHPLLSSSSRGRDDVAVSTVGGGFTIREETG
jgi:pilus assembly protein CpaF